MRIDVYKYHLLSFAGVDPDDTYNETPYEKGYCFVSYLAHLVGDQDQFDNFLKVQSTLHEGKRTRSR